MEKLKLEIKVKDITTKEAFAKCIRLKKASNLSSETIKYYEDCFRYFSEFYPETSPCSGITRDVYLQFVEYLQETRQAKTVTLNSYLRGVRAILYFFMEENYMEQFKIKLLKMEKTIKETFTDEEVEKLLEKPDMKKSNFAQYRNWVMANYLFGTGNRIRTVLNVQIGHLDFGNNLIFMGKTKNGRQQLIPMSASLASVLKEYLCYRKGDEEDYLFCTLHGEQLTRNGVSSLMQKYHKDRGVTKTSLHMYRHTFARHWILNGGDIFRLQKILGHSSLDMVRNYVEMFNEDLKKDFEVFNPLDNFTSCNKKGNVLTMKK